MLAWSSLHHDPSHSFGKIDECQWIATSGLYSCAWLIVSLPGPPITENSTIMELIANKVVVGIGCEGIWSARSLPFDVAWVSHFLDLIYLGTDAKCTLGCYWSWGPNFQRRCLCAWFAEYREITWCWSSRSRPSGFDCDTRKWLSWVQFQGACCDLAQGASSSFVRRCNLISQESRAYIKFLCKADAFKKLSSSDFIFNCQYEKREKKDHPGEADNRFLCSC